MQTNSKDQPENHQKITFFEIIAIIYKWLEIVVAVMITGIIISCAVFYSSSDPANRSLAIAILILALLAGIILATIVIRKKRKSDYNSENHESP
jgi:uncharacterized membrane protein